MEFVALGNKGKLSIEEVGWKYMRKYFGKIIKQVG
jgi:hypothetical protein